MTKGDLIKACKHCKDTSEDGCDACVFEFGSDECRVIPDCDESIDLLLSILQE